MFPSAAFILSPSTTLRAGNVEGLGTDRRRARTVDPVYPEQGRRERLTAKSRKSVTRQVTPRAPLQQTPGERCGLVFRPRNKLTHRGGRGLSCLSHLPGVYPEHRRRVALAKTGAKSRGAKPPVLSHVEGKGAHHARREEGEYPSDI
jgi:hypothetical protein